MVKQGISIKVKIRSVILLTSVVVLFLTSSAFVATEVISFKRDLVRNVSVLAQVVADNSTAALAFQNTPEASKVLSALKAEPNIVEAVLYDRDKHLFARYPGSATRPLFPDMALGKTGYKFEKGSLIFAQPVQQAGSHLGVLVLRSSQQALYLRLQLYTLIGFLVLVGSLLMAYLLATKMQQAISQPILALAETAKVVSLENNYSVRAKKSSQDEVGLLTDAFNQMLDQIQHSRQELRLAHEQISQHAQQLERTVGERTVKLQQTIGELEAFSFSISHDMRAPLRAMSRYAQILLQDAGAKLDPAEQGYIGRIITGAQRLDHLIQDSLSYSQVSRAELPMQPIDVEPLICAVIDQYPELFPSQADIEFKLPLLKVLGHEASLSQCLSNLLANAVKFVASGNRPHITIWTQPIDSKVRLCIQDNGIGIASEDQERIFGMFARIHSEKVYQGTGIGLAIVRKAVERMGGCVGLESQIGKGSIFWLDLRKGEINESNGSAGGR